MFKKIFETLREILRAPTIYDTLEAHIVAGNPQSAEDVERLERQFNQRNRTVFDRYY